MLRSGKSGRLSRKKNVGERRQEKPRGDEEIPEERKEHRDRDEPRGKGILHKRSSYTDLQKPAEEILKDILVDRSSTRAPHTEILHSFL